MRRYLLIGDEQASRVHRLAHHVLEEHHVRLGWIHDRIEVHTHKGGHRRSPSRKFGMLLVRYVGGEHHDVPQQRER